MSVESLHQMLWRSVISHQALTESVEELREEMRLMEAANATPEEFGLKVRSHPDTLIVTVRNKMGTGEHVVVSIGLAKTFHRNDDAPTRRQRPG